MTSKRHQRKLDEARARKERDQRDATPGAPPTTERLARALEQAGAPTDMIGRARDGYYDDYKSELATPCMQLVADLRSAGLHDLAERATQGKFDATAAESEAWAASPGGQETMAELTANPQMRAQLARMAAALGMPAPTGGPLAAAMRSQQATGATPTGVELDGDDPERDKTLILAAADLVERTGGTQFDFGMANEDAQAVTEADWYVSAYYEGTRIIEQDHRTPSAAAAALARRLLHGGKCRCGRVVSLDPAGVHATEKVMLSGETWTVEQQRAAGVCVWRLGGGGGRLRWVGGCGAGR